MTNTTKTKTVVRKYYSKTLDMEIVKVYTYDEKKSKRYQETAKRKRKQAKISSTPVKIDKAPKPKLLTSGGRKVKSNIEKLYKGIPIKERAQYQDVIETWDYKKRGALTKERLIAIVEGNKTANFIANTGFTAAQVAAKLGVSEETLLDSKNWSSDKDHSGNVVFTDPNTGRSWAVSFDYEYEGNIDSVFKEINVLKETA